MPAPGLYLVQTTPGYLAHCVTASERLAVMFRVMSVQSGPLLPRSAEDADDGPMTPLLLRLERTAEVLDLSPSSVKRLIKAGELPSVKVGGATRVRVEDLRAYVDRLNNPSEEPHA